MLSRLLAVALLAVVASPSVPADPQGMTGGTLPTLVCVYVDPGPPPYFILRDCGKVVVGVAVNSTGGAVWARDVPCLALGPPTLFVGECGSAAP